jgi:hypothetical protein
VYFGFVVNGSNPANLTSGIARIGFDGSGNWVSAASLSGNSAFKTIAFNAAPAVSPDGSTIYAVATDVTAETGILVAADANTLAPVAHVELFDPQTGEPATISGISSASPMTGPDGDVYFGVLESPCCTSHNDRGWMLHFNAALSETKTPGSFGWDDTASVTPASAVPSYTGSSAYLILTKYNNYAGSGTGNGVNKMAVLDPNGTQQDEYSTAPVTVMKEVLTVTGVTPDTKYTAEYPDAVREWCINSAAVDPATKSALVNSEDGNLYRWSFVTNTLTQKVSLTAGVGEAYTPTIVGADGKVYAINDATLFAVGN